MSYTELEIRQSTLDRILVMLESSYKNISQQDWLNLAIAFTELNKADLLYVDKVESLLLDAYTYTVDKIENPKDLKAMVNRLQLLQGRMLPTPQLVYEGDTEIYKTDTPYIAVITTELGVRVEFETSIFKRMEVTDMNTATTIIKKLEILDNVVEHEVDAWVRARLVSYASDGKTQGVSEWTKPLVFKVKNQIITGLIEAVTYPSGLPTGIPTTGQYRRIGVPFRNNKWYSKTDLDTNDGGTHSWNTDNHNNFVTDAEKQMPQRLGGTIYTNLTSLHYKFFMENKQTVHANIKRRMMSMTYAGPGQDITAFTFYDDYIWHKPYDAPENKKATNNIDPMLLRPVVEIPEHWVIDIHFNLKLKQNPAQEHVYYLKLCSLENFEFNLQKYLQNIPMFSGYYDLNNIYAYGRANLTKVNLNDPIHPIIKPVYQYNFMVGATPANYLINNKVVSTYIGPKTQIKSTIQSTDFPYVNGAYKKMFENNPNGELPMDYYEYRAINLLFTIENGFVGNSNKTTNYSPGLQFEKHANRSDHGRKCSEYINRNGCLITAPYQSLSGMGINNPLDNDGTSYRGIELFGNVWTNVSLLYNGNSRLMKVPSRKDARRLLFTNDSQMGNVNAFPSIAANGQFATNPCEPQSGYNQKIKTFTTFYGNGELFDTPGYIRNKVGASSTTYAASQQDFNGSAGDVSGIILGTQLDICGTYNMYFHASWWSDQSVWYMTYKLPSEPLIKV